MVNESQSSNDSNAANEEVNATHSETESEKAALVNEEESEDQEGDTKNAASNASKGVQKKRTCFKCVRPKLGNCCTPLKSCFSFSCCGLFKKKSGVEENEQDNSSMTSKEVNDFIEDELKKLSSESIKVDK